MDIQQIVADLDARISAIEAYADAIVDAGQQLAMLNPPSTAALDQLDDSLGSVGTALLAAGGEAAAAIDSARHGVLHASVEHAVHEVETITNQLAEQEDLLSEADRALTSALNAFSSEIEAAKGALHADHAEFDQMLQELATSYKSQFGAYDEALHKLDALIGTQLAPELSKELGTVFAAIELTRSESLVELETTLRARMGIGIEYFMDTAENKANAFRESVNSSANALVAYSEERIAALLQQRLERLQQRAIESLERAIVEAIAETEINVALTSALSSIMPELIAINRALPAIEAAIEFFKEAKRLSLGLW